MSTLAYCKEIIFSSESSEVLEKTNKQIHFIQDSNIPLSGLSSIEFRQDHFYFRKDKFGTFHVFKDKIIYNLDHDHANLVKLSVLLNQPIACYGFLNNFLVLHSSAFIYRGCAYLILGRPMSGKSTLCTSLLEHAQFLTEDIALINDKDEVIPSYPLAKVVENKINLKYFQSSIEIPFDDRNRSACSIKPSLFYQTPSKIAGIFIIERGKTGQIMSADVKERLAAIFNSSFRPYADNDEEFETFFFQKIKNIVALDMFRLPIPDNESPEETSKKIIDYIDSRN